MNRHTEKTRHTAASGGQAPEQTNTPRPHTSTTARVRLAEIMRGLILGGAAFLLGSCPLLFGAVPLGVAFLTASSSYTLYILGGLILAAFLRPVMLMGWGWVGVYLFCLGLRLLIRCYVDPPVSQGGQAPGLCASLKLCIRSVVQRFSAAEEPVGAAASDYYAGAHSGTATAGREGDAGASEKRYSDGNMHAPSRGRLLAEHPFLRMLTAAVTGFTAGLVAWVAGGFRVYELAALLFLLLFTPLVTGIFIGCFGEAGLTLIFSPTPLASVRRATGNRADTAKSETDDPATDASSDHSDTANVQRSSRLRTRLASLAERVERALSEDGGIGGGASAAVHAERGIGRLAACYPLLPLVSVGIWLLCVIFSARDMVWAPFGAYLLLSAADLLALLVTLIGASRLGVLPGIGMAVICGLAAGFSMIPALVVAATVYALLRGLSHRAGIIGGCTASAVYTAAAEGIAVLGGRLSSLVLAIPIFLISERLWVSLPAEATVHKDPAAEELSARVSAALSAEARAKAQRARLEALSDALGGLSRRFGKLSGRLRQPRLSELRRLTADALSERCAHCRARENCRAQTEALTDRLSEQLASILHRRGRVEPADLPDELYELCPYSEEVCNDVNQRYAKLSEALMHNEKTDVFAADYAAMATLLSDVLEEDVPDATSAEENRVAADRIFEYLSSEGVTVQGVVVAGSHAGRRRVIVQGVGLRRLEASAPTVRAQLESLCETRLTPPAFEGKGDDGVTVMTLAPEATLHVQYAGSTVPAGTDSGDALPEPLTDETPRGGYAPPAVCGDHIALFRTEGACFYALISDGMGSGEDASLTSDICVMFLERMLAAGGRVELSLRMLDNYICAKNSGTRDECSATVDLMELDLMDGQAVFAKNGASPTYVVRDGTVYKLRSRTMPLGILKGMDPRLLRFRMHPGDVVVMVSDGVTLGNDDCPWLIDLLSSPLPANMDTLRSDIIRRALSAGSEDDLSAIAIRVEKA